MFVQDTVTVLRQTTACAMMSILVTIVASKNVIQTFTVPEMDSVILRINALAIMDTKD